MIIEKVVVQEFLGNMYRVRQVYLATCKLRFDYIRLEKKLSYPVSWLAYLANVKWNDRWFCCDILFYFIFRCKRLKNLIR